MAQELKVLVTDGEIHPLTLKVISKHFDPDGKVIHGEVRRVKVIELPDEEGMKTVPRGAHAAKAAPNELPGILIYPTEGGVDG